MADAAIHAPDSDHVFTAYGSNAFRLTLRQWMVVLAIVIPLVALTPVLWKGVEKREVPADFRMNYDLSEDYWLYSQCAQTAAARSEWLVVGDSVIWGQYVAPQQTLVHYLNERAGTEKFANLGLNGAHPLALEGLVEHYGAAISGKNVLLLCNALWMGSPKHDLQTEDEFRFNHPKLVPQFSPWIKCYKAELSPRIGNVVERNTAFNSLVTHLQQSYFERSDIPLWTLEHPYQSPLKPLTFVVPPDDGKLRSDPIPWTQQGIKPQNFPFVELKSSLQWQAFKRAAEVLRARGNNVVIVINPLNEHMLTEASRKVYTSLRQQMQEELAARQWKVVVPALLPSEEYADASHPLSEGYRRMAGDVYTRLK